VKDTPFAKVTEELIEYLKMRWLGFEGEGEFARYWNGEPIIFEGELEGWLKRFPWARTVYASADLYRGKERLASDVVLKVRPDAWEAVARAVKREGASPWFLSNSSEVYVLVSRKCFSSLKRVTPSYVARKLAEEAGLEVFYEALTVERFPPAPYTYSSSGPFLPLRRPNEEAIDVCEGSLEEFVKRCEEGAPREFAHPGRFPVMALLQAVRYYLVMGNLMKALSFGLNRAIFYAWLKYYYNPRSARRPPGYDEKVLKKIEKLRPLSPLKDKAPLCGEWFCMGDKPQRPEDFYAQVWRRFERSGLPFEIAWDKALDYVSSFPYSVLINPNSFFKLVYEPVRDDFSRVIEHKARRRATLSDFFQRGSR